MSKAAQIRAALADGLLTKEQLAEKLGWTPELSPSQYAADLCYQVKEGVKHWALKSMMVRVPKQQRPRRLKGFKAEAREKARKARKAGKVKSYKQLRRALKQPQRPAIAELARDNYLATQDQLISVIQERVAGLHDDEVIAPLLAAHQRARQLYQAAQS